MVSVSQSLIRIFEGNGHDIIPDPHELAQMVYSHLLLYLRISYGKYRIVKCQNNWTDNYLREMIDHVKKELSENYPNFEVVTDNEQDYYQIPLVSAVYTQDMIVLQIPIYIKPITQKPLLMYKIKTIPSYFFHFDITLPLNYFRSELLRWPSLYCLYTLGSAHNE